MENTIIVDSEQIARSISLPSEKVRATVELLDDGNTVPFITRYRKDRTGGLDEEQIRGIQQQVTKLRIVAERKESILKSLQSRDKLTDDLRRRIESATSVSRLEDLYLPFKTKKQTLASVARSRGLESLAIEILRGDPATADPRARAAEFVNADKGLATVDDVLQGVRHIIAETFAEDLAVRDALRQILRDSGVLHSTRHEDTLPAKKAEQPAKKTEQKPRQKSTKSATRETPSGAATDDSNDHDAAGKHDENQPRETAEVGATTAANSTNDAEPEPTASTGSPAVSVETPEPNVEQPSAANGATAAAAATAAEPAAAEPAAAEPAAAEPAVSEDSAVDENLAPEKSKLDAAAVDGATEPESGTSIVSDDKPRESA